MAKRQNKLSLQKRDWAIIGLFLAIIGTNWLWYQSSQNLSKRLDPVNVNDYKQFIQIQKLKQCIDEDTRPCGITLLPQ